VNAQRIHIERVGRAGRAWLELKGSILLYHTDSFVATASTFIPIEWVEVRHGARRDPRRLWLGLLALMSALLFALPVLGLLHFTDYRPGDVLLIVVLSVPLLACLACCVAALVLFACPRPFTTLAITGTPTGMTIDFWRRPGKAPELDALVETLEAAPTFTEERLSFPIRMHHMWRRPRRYRVALLRGLAVSFILYLLFLPLEVLRMAGRITGFSRAYFLFLLLPPLFYVGVALFRRGYLLRESRAYRQAVRAYQRGALEDARRQLRALLAEEPDHDASRLLLIQVCTEQYAFEEAAAQCEKLSREHPLLARRLQANIWSIQRMHQRMEQT